MKSAFRIEMLNAFPSRGLEYAGSMEGQASQQSKACRATQLRAAAEGQGGPAAGFSIPPDLSSAISVTAALCWGP